MLGNDLLEIRRGRESQIRVVRKKKSAFDEAILKISDISPTAFGLNDIFQYLSYIAVSDRQMCEHVSAAASWEMVLRYHLSSEQPCLFQLISHPLLCPRPFDSSINLRLH